MKIAIIADSHFSERSRFEECIRIHDWIVNKCREENVELTLHAGDVFDSKSTPKEREAVASWLQKQACLGPVVIARGNHDALGDLKLFEKLGTKYPIIVEEEANIHCFNKVDVVAVAWPRKASLATSGITDVHDAIQSLISGLASQCGNNIKILLMHAMVQGSLTSTGQPLVGCDMEVSIQDLCATEFNFVALGHIHKFQDWIAGRDGKQTDIVYPGSPRPTNFGETEDKGFLIIDTDDHDESFFVKTPTTPMAHVDAEWTPDGLKITKELEFYELMNAEVRLRYTVPSDQRDAARAKAQEMAATMEFTDGAKSVKIEEVVKATTRARMPEVAKAKTLREKLEAYWQGETFSEERKRRLLELATQLEEEVYK